MKGPLGWLDRKLFPQVQRDTWGSQGLTPPPRRVGVSISGAVVDAGNTLGLATAGAAVKLVSQSVAIMPLKVYEGQKPDVQEARDSWQWFRLKEQPNDDQSAFDFWQDCAASIETAGNAYIWKALVRRPVQGAEDIELYLVDPDRVMVKRDETGRLYYEVRRQGQVDRVPASQILHIRGWSATPGADVGLSTIALHREALGTAIASTQYASRFFSNGTSIPGFITVPGDVPQDAVDRLQVEWAQRRAGLENAHRPAVLANGAGWIATGISMKDAQYVEMSQFTGEEICRIFGVSPHMLGFEMENSRGTDDDVQRFLTVDMHPRFRRIEMAVGRDPDLFPAGSEMFPEFLLSAALRPSLQARNAAYKDARQTGYILLDEIRELENMRALTDAEKQELQQTPVGGAPNTAPNVPANQGG